MKGAALRPLADERVSVPIAGLCGESLRRRDANPWRNLAAFAEAMQETATDLGRAGIAEEVETVAGLAFVGEEMAVAVADLFETRQRKPVPDGVMLLRAEGAVTRAAEDQQWVLQIRQRQLAATHHRGQGFQVRERGCQRQWADVLHLGGGPGAQAVDAGGGADLATEHGHAGSREERVGQLGAPVSVCVQQTRRERPPERIQGESYQELCLPT